MSYIRCLSNPEGLYIWADVDGTVKVTIAGENSKDEKCLPIAVFDGLIKKYNKNYGETPCEYKGAKVDEVWIPTQSKFSAFVHAVFSIILSPYYCRKFGFDFHLPKTKKDLENWKFAYYHRNGKYQYRLSYGNWHVDMWQVTWEHIVK